MQTKNTQTTTTIYCSSCGKRVSGVYYTSTMSDLIVCHSCRQVRPYGGNTPSIKHRVGEADVTADVTTTTGTRQPRQSREAQRNARIHQAFLTLREVAGDGQGNHRCYSVASTSDTQTHYTLTWDTDNDRVHCNCPHGTLSARGECVHIAAMRRYIHGLRESERRAHDPVEIAKRAEESQRISRAMLARDQRPFSLLAR